MKVTQTFTHHMIIPDDLFQSGVYIKIWWSRYKKFFYGRIISYDPRTHQHSVIYEDGDIRS